MRNIEKEMFTISGGDFKKWFENLTNEEKQIYKIIIKNLKTN